MQLKDGATVYTADGQTVGSIDRVVIDPRTDEVTHIVVRQGFFFTEDKVVPTDLIDVATEEEVRLRADVEDLDDLPRFEERYYIPPEDFSGAEGEMGYPVGYARPYYWYPPVGAAGLGYYGGAYGYPTAPYVTHTVLNIPEGTIALQEGARVISADGKEVGNVEEVVTDANIERATHLLITEGWLFTEKRLIPVDWIKDVAEDEIRLAVSSRTLEQVPEYQP
ncbi:MAG: hypothetical protein DCC55_08765 [Chloroflexi bacterium]|nr:MAG: hypothetical protein DCC55_08765 [Chloroflexota bacterium]